MCNPIGDFMKVLCFGNLFIKEDNLAVEIGKKLHVKGVNFEICKDVDPLLEQDSEEVIILDVVKGLDAPRLFDNLDDFDVRRMFSLHDFDVGFVLRLLQEVGRIKKVRIIGIPQQGNKKLIKEQVKKLLLTL